jgi:hypothetical protein
MAIRGRAVAQHGGTIATRDAIFEKNSTRIRILIATASRKNMTAARTEEHTVSHTTDAPSNKLPSKPWLLLDASRSALGTRGLAAGAFRP